MFLMSSLALGTQTHGAGSGVGVASCVETAGKGQIKKRYIVQTNFQKVWVELSVTIW